MVTPGLAVNVIGLPAVPELVGLTEVPAYVPALTRTVSPATAFFAAAAIVQNDRAAVPGPVSEQAGLVLSTVYGGHAYAVPPEGPPATMTAPSHPPLQPVARTTLAATGQPQ